MKKNITPSLSYNNGNGSIALSEFDGKSLGQFTEFAKASKLFDEKEGEEQVNSQIKSVYEQGTEAVNAQKAKEATKAESKPADVPVDNSLDSTNSTRNAKPARTGNNPTDANTTTP